MPTPALERLVPCALALSLLIAGSAFAEPDRVIRGPVTKTPETRGGVPGYWIEYTDYTFRKISDRFAELYPGGSGLSSAVQQYLIKLLQDSGLAPTDENIRRVADAVIAWQGSAPGNYASMTAGTYNGYGYDLMSRLSQALRGTTNYNSHESTAGWNILSAVASARGWSTYDPLVLDLNGNGKVDVTGMSAAKYRMPKNQVFMQAGSVMFDLKGTSRPVRTEWITSGDGFLVDNRKGKSTQLLAQGKNLSIFNLMGDADGNPSGFVKLARFFDAEAMLASSDKKLGKGLGLISGKELDDLLVWIDNGDGKAEKSELHTLASLGITEIRLPYRAITNADGELIEQATFVRHGKPQIMQEVWFATEDEQRSAQ